MSDPASPRAEPASAPSVVTGGRRRAALGFIFFTALMDVVALGIMIPVLPNLVKELSGGDLAYATRMTGLFATAWGLMQFVFSPIQGMLSDRFGRRPVLLISIFGLTLDYIVMALAPTLAWLFVGRLINGITSASFSTAGAYIADVSKPEERAKNFGLIGSAFGVGFIIGPALGGLLGRHSLRLPFYVSAALGAMNWLYGLIVLPESLPPERRLSRFDWKKANPVGSLRLLRERRSLLGLAGVTTLFDLAHNVFPSIFVLYVGYRFGWSALQAGLMMMAVGVVNVITQGFFVGPAVKRLGERGALLLGLLGAAAGFALYAVAPTPPFFSFGIVVFGVAALINPGMQGLMTRRVAPSEQGQLQGANSAIMGLTSIVGPQIFTGVLAWTVAQSGAFRWPGLAVLIASIMMLLAFVLAVRVTRPGVDAPPSEVVPGQVP